LLVPLAVAAIGLVLEVAGCQGSRNFPTVDHRNSSLAGTGWAADYRVVVGVTSACLAAARKFSARARWVRIR
jgi:hypothetical protein